ncbi:hypothetical protein Tco_0974536 [Tanacetum coccineum]|uniref:Uncharacterized protein n=1 Tax=Tanacetum coccineum TaxID=301880 RepID=A0ABQ5EBV3_9ASTR
MDHRAYCALKNANPVLHIIGKSRFLKFNQVAELRNEVYEHSCAYRERRNKWHNTRIQDKEFMEGQEVLVFSSRLKLFHRKLETRRYGPYTLSKVSPYETVEVIGKEGICFKGLHVAIEDAVAHKDLRVGDGYACILHLLFIPMMLHINLHKSKLYGVGVALEDVE